MNDWENYRYVGWVISPDNLTREYVGWQRVYVIPEKRVETIAFREIVISETGGSFHKDTKND